MTARLAVLVTYCGERELLAECLGSFLAQSDPPDEIIVYDDASSEPAASYVPAGAPVRVIRGEHNVGPSRARNALLRATTAGCVHFHDADDLVHANWGRSVRAALADGADAVFTEVASVSESGERISNRVLDLDTLDDGEDLVRFCLRGAMLVPAGTYGRDVVAAIGGYRETLWQSEDFDFHVRLAARQIRYATVTEPLVIIRVRRQSRSQNRVETLSSMTQSIELLAGELPPIYRDDLADAAVRTGSALFKLGARAEAAQAFALASRLGRPTLDRQRSMYRALARSVGPAFTERAALVYRRMIPRRVRTY